MKKFFLLLLICSFCIHPVFSKNTGYRKIVLPGVHSNPIKGLDQSTPAVRPKNRLGLIMNLGIGFQNTTMFTMTDGGDSKISFGGGLTFGAKYGHEFGRHFDLALDANYQYSYLKPHLDNVDATFARTFVSFTPSYIFHLGKTDATRLKIGPGVDSYFGSAFTIKGSAVSGGFDDTWKYKSAFGYHVNALIEYNFNAKFSFSYGLRWSTVSYEFESGNTHVPTDSKLKTPDGSAIDFLFGLNFHF